LWNYAPPTGTGSDYTPESAPAGPSRTFDLHLDHLPHNSHATLIRVDDTHGNALAAFDAMGRPRGSLTQTQIATLKRAAVLPPPEKLPLTNGQLVIAIPAHGLAVLLIHK
jgi:xylan 1,4-beta-xylosidase